MEKYLEHLNEAQRAAVLHMDGPVMIIAGAGSGKTRVLVHRIVHLMTQGVDPFNILALTFTNKAAREMKGRIATLAGEEARNLWMGTFHSVFARILRVDAHRIGYPQSFTIYDTDDAKSVIKDIVKGQGLDEKVYKPNIVLHRISSAKNNLFSWKEYQENPELISEDKQAGKPHLGLLYELYQKRLFSSGSMDFDDLIFNTLILLRDHPDLLHKYQSKFRYIMVDEFQDTNYAQYIVVRKLAAQHQNICVVGDDAQSIYAFRGANIQNILSFENDYTDLNTFKLEQNYRSTGVIVNAANSVIANNKAQLPKNVWTRNNDGDKITLFKTLSDNEEGSVVAAAIFEARMRDQLMNNDFAVLYRTNAQSRAMEEALRKKGIPYRIYGGISFYSRKEIKDLLAYFRLAVNPDDEEALKRVINYPKREIGKTSWEKLVVAAHNKGVSVWKVTEQIHSIETGIAASTRNRIADFVSMIKSFGAMLGSKDAYELASHIASSTGLLKELYNDRTPEGISHYENVQELLNAIKEFTDKGETGLPAPSSEEDNEQGLRTLDIFLQDIALITDADKDTDEKDVVSLMTIHSAKGLEFRNVFVVGLEENLFPSQMSMQSRDDLEEERRLFYVAITRAEKKLYLSYAASRYRWGNLTGCEPSRFLEEIDEQYLESTESEPQNDFADLRRTNWSGFGTSKKTKVSNTVLPGPGFRRLRKKDSSSPSASQTDAFEAASADQISVGMEVEHQKFGTGKVINVEGAAPDIKATVFFPGHGNKHLLLKFAKLRIIS